MSRRIVGTIAACFLLGVMSGRADAAVVFVYSTGDSGFAAIPILETWEVFAPKDTPFTTTTRSGVTYTSIFPPDNIWVSSPGYTNYGIPITTTSILTTSGNENFEFSPSFTARRIGFDVYTINDPGNPFSVPGAANVQVTVTTTTGIHGLSLAPPAGNFGFLGIVSDDPILKVRWLADQGGVRNTGIDNLRFASTVPEPLSITLLCVGLAATASRRFRHKRR